MTSGRAKQVRAIDGQYLNNVITGVAGDADIGYLSSHAGLAKAGVSY